MKIEVRHFIFSIATGLALGGLLFIAGCKDQPSPSPAPTQPDPGKTARHDATDHGHAEKGIKSIGDHHGKLLVEAGGTLRLFVLGKDERQVATIERQQLQAHLQAEGETEAVKVLLESDPQPGDPEGKTSQFVGQVPEPLRGKALDVTFPQITIGGQRNFAEFKSVPGSGHGDMPKGVSGAKEKELFFTAAGKYTEDDIKANGPQTPKQKYRGMRANHRKPQPGELMCPVTDNKSDTRCAWIVGGKRYEFCCPPCIEDFVELAKTQPEMIKDPASYVKK